MTDLSHLQETDYLSKKKDMDERQLFKTPFVKHNQQIMKRALPVTSTAVCNTRMVRRSTRLSTRRSLHSALMSKISPKITHDSEQSFMADVSIMETNVTAIEANIDSSRLDTFSKATDKTYDSDEIAMIQHEITVNQNDQNTKPEKAHRRKSTRIEAIKATQKNFMILQGQSPLPNTTKKRPCKKGNVSCKFQFGLFHIYL